MNLFTGEEADAFFGGDVPAAIRHLIDQARALPREQAAAALWTATLSAPGALPVYYLLYKLHASLGQLDPALKAAEGGLRAAAEAAGLDADWRRVALADADFQAVGPARFWLFTLKALAFLHTRRGESAEAAARVAKLRELDPQDHMGATVVAGLLQRATAN